MSGLSIGMPTVPPSLLNSYCVPNLQFYYLIPQRDGFGGKLDADGGVAVPSEGGIDELHDYGGLSDTLFA